MTAFTAIGAAGRRERLTRLAAQPDLDILVIGGGINGISAFRELALQGLRVALVEKNDYCHGASGALSRMVHGGLRYMETGEFKLVREALAERNRLLRNAPHYVGPLATTVPLFDYASGLTSALQRFLRLTEKPSRRGAALVKVGLTLYDWFTRGTSGMPGHGFAGRAATFRRWPNLNPDVRCTATYYDAQITYPERLGLEMIQDTVTACLDATALNYVAFNRLEANGAVILHDCVTGDDITVRPKLVINAGGAWTDIANESLAEGAPRLIGGTKGSHLIVDNPKLYDELGDHMIYYENQEGRVCILFRYFDRVLIGSTDIRVDTPDTVRCEDEERAYILESVRFVFPSIEITPDQIVYTFSGVRPLPYSDDGPTGRISRDHSVQALEPTATRPFPVLCLIGGKWTTFRGFGELVADDVLARLGRDRTVDTKEMPIGGGRDFPAPTARSDAIAELARAHGLSEARAQTLFARYGTGARQVAKTLATEGDTPLKSLPEYSCGELIHLIRHEDVVMPADLLIRRTAIAITGRLSTTTVREVLAIMADTCGWSAEYVRGEYETLRDLLATRHRVTLAPLPEAAETLQS
ncbi:glycerol-3-phosphate dehydrogenase/oxidase [Thalassospira sp. TSL5-1]|uniref:glycerol-3-phosphate dehydrogenase/oxidase n=1 Tax=Thalassospira sp. TSL5-1 TaxID=1544451 RepID=UPI0009F88516|nr:glycerol-3-phosphate dehydrogenase/oxidase [Thalassospira sp. TSL5-1]